MHIHTFGRRLLTALLAASLLSLSACSAANTDFSISTPTLSDSELPNTTPPARPLDTTDYQALAHAVFTDVPEAAAADFTYEATEGGIKLTAYAGQGGTVIIPQEIDGTQVVALGDELFRDNTAITALSIPDSVTEIGASLLAGCKSLQVLRTPQMAKTRKDAQYLSYLFGGASAQSGAFKIGRAHV